MRIDELDIEDNYIITIEELNSLFNDNTIDELLNHEYVNPLLQSKVYSSINNIEFNDNPKLRLFLYLCKGVDLNIDDADKEYLPKVWNLPGVAKYKLFDLLIPGYRRSRPVNSDKITKILTELNKFSDCILVRSEIEYYENELDRVKLKEAKKSEIDNYNKLLDKYTYESLGDFDSVIASNLLYLAGYDGSLTHGKDFEKLLWSATGLYLTDIIEDITNYIKVQDKIVCTFVPDIRITTNKPEITLSDTNLHKRYIKLCTKLANDAGRLREMYKGYSLANLKSTNSRYRQVEKVQYKSDYEVLKFVDNHINEGYQFSEVKDLIPTLHRNSIEPKLEDECDSYFGFTFTSDSYLRLSKMLLSYDISEFTNVRKLISGIFDAEIQVSKLSIGELRSMDNDLNCQVINKLVNSSILKKSLFLTDLIYLKICAHIGITLNNFDKDSYIIQFNAVNIGRVMELIVNSNSGYNTILKVLERLSQSNSYYGRVLKSFTESIYEVYKYNINNKLGL